MSAVRDDGRDPHDRDGRDPRDRGGLWPLIAAPTAWLLHFLACYVVAAIVCAKAGAGAPLGDARVALWVCTAVALGAIAVAGAWGWRRLRGGAFPRDPTASLHSSPPGDGPAVAARRRFLGFATFLLCVLSAIAVVYTALAFVVIGTCR